MPWQPLQNVTGKFRLGRATQPCSSEMFGAQVQNCTTLDRFLLWVGAKTHTQNTHPRSAKGASTSRVRPLDQLAEHRPAAAICWVLPMKRDQVCQPTAGLCWPAQTLRKAAVKLRQQPNRAKSIWFYTLSMCGMHAPLPPFSLQPPCQLR